MLSGLAGGILLDRFTADPSPPKDMESGFRLMAEAWSIIQRHYVDRSALKARELTYGAIGGMVDALGDTGHSQFLSPEMNKQLGRFESNKFQGIGAEVRVKGGNVVIVAPLKNSPAEQAGIRAGDVILKVDAKDVAGLPLERVVERILGPVGTPVTLTLMNPRTDRTREVTVVRADITINNVSWRRLPGKPLAHLHIAGFNKDAAEDLRKALKAIEKQKLAGIIFDLRNNPGGLLDEAVASASEFLTGGNVLLVKDAQGKTEPIPVLPGGIARKTPLVVLVNSGSASASEIVAGALQDARRAILVGETTFGTGTVLKNFGLPDGSALLLAVEEWLTPAGHLIWHRGITPDERVSLPPEATPLFPEGEKDLTAARLPTIEDAQLLRAIRLLSPD